MVLVRSEVLPSPPDGRGRVGAETLEIDDLGPDGDVLSEQLHAGGAVQQVAAQRTGDWKPHEYHGAVRPPQVVLQVVANAAPRVAHLPLAEMMTLGVLSMFSSLDLHRLRQVQAGEAEHMCTILHQRQGVVIQIAMQIAAEDGSGLFLASGLSTYTGKSGMDSTSPLSLIS